MVSYKGVDVCGEVDIVNCQQVMGNLPNALDYLLIWGGEIHCI